MLEILDKIDEVNKYDKKQRIRTQSEIDTMVVHRIGPKLNEVNIHGAEDLAAAFCAHPEWGTGAQMPYAMVIREDGIVEQALKLTDAGPHARKYNSRSFGVAVVGDHRRQEPTEQQYDALCDLAAAWVTHSWAIGLLKPIELLVKGHDECEGGSSDKSKRCPGDKLSMVQLRKDVLRILEEDIFHAGVLV